VLQLAATDKQGKSVSRKIKLGAVPVGADGLVQVPDPAISRVLGPLTISGSSPWPCTMPPNAPTPSTHPYQTVYPAASIRLSGAVTVSVTNGNIYVPPSVAGSEQGLQRSLKTVTASPFPWRTPDGLDGEWRATVSAIADRYALSGITTGNPHRSHSTT